MFFGSYRESKKILPTLLASVLGLGMLAVVLFGIGVWQVAVAAPIINNNTGFWSDTFSDGVGLSTQAAINVNVAQQRLELASAAVFSQTNWHDGPSILTATASTVNGYASGVGVASGITGELSLGFSLPAGNGLGDYRQDGYPDIIFTNYYSGPNGNIPANVSSLYYGSASGITDALRADLSVTATTSSAVADLNDDGYLDIVIAHDGLSDGVHENYIFWGSASGYSTANRDVLPGVSSPCVAIADLNNDGYLDIVICNFLDESFNLETDSYIYWGSAATYTITNRTSLPTVGVIASYIADFNADGRLDLVFNNYHNSGNSLLTTTYEISSYLYWGSPAGFTTTNRLELPTIGAHGSSAADLNKDGYLDLVINNRRTGGLDSMTSTYQINSYIYWGSASGLTVTNRSELPTRGSYGNSVADLDNDGYPEIIFSNHFDGMTHNQDSFIYWNDSGTFTDTNRTGLPTLGAAGNCVADINLDGYQDIIFANRRSGGDHTVGSFVYWGDSGGYNSNNFTEVSTFGAVGCSIAGGTIAAANTTFGNVYALPISGTTTLTDTESTPYIYPGTGVLTSTGFDGVSLQTWHNITWTTSLTTGTNIAIDVATSNDGVSWSAWTNVAASSSNGSNNAVLSLVDSRFIRYRATLTGSSDHRRTPKLLDVSLRSDPFGGQATSTLIAPASINRWKVVTWTVQLAAGQAITVQVLDGNGALIPNATLPGNTTGFTTGTISLTNLSAVTYPALRLRALFTRNSLADSPKLNDWSVSWIVPPVSEAGGPYSGDEAASIALSGSGSFAPGGGALSYAWDLDNDGQYDDALSVSTNISYSEPGLYNVYLLVTDTQGLTATDIGTVTVANLAPTSNAGGPYNGNEAALIQLNGSGSSDPGGTTLAYAWDLNNDDVFTDSTVVSPTYSWGEPGAYPVRLRVADAQGLTNTHTVTVNVANLAPTSKAGGPYSGNEGASIGFNGAGSSDPGGGTLLYAWDLNQDGQFDDAFTTTSARSFSEPGTYTVGLVVSDTQGLKHSSVATVSVANLAPTANAGGPYLQTAGVTLTLNASASSDPGGGVLTYTWDLDNDGQFDDGSGVTIDNLWTSAGTYTVRVRAQDSGLLTSIGTAPVTITVATLHHITLAPATATITNGLSIAYTTIAFDEFNNSLGDVSAGATYSITNGAGGSWLNNVYTSENPGTWTVTATHNALTTTATLTVKPEYKNFLPVVLR